MRTSGLAFVEAVKALEVGQCESIRHEDWSQKYEPQFLVIQNHRLVWQGGENSFGICLNASQYTDRKWILVNPKPTTEPAETIQYVVIEPSDGHVVVMTDSESQAKGLLHGQRQLVEVRIPYQREVKEKVLHRVDITNCKSYGNGTHIHVQPDMIPVHARIYAEWEE